MREPNRWFFGNQATGFRVDSLSSRDLVIEAVLTCGSSCTLAEVEEAWREAVKAAVARGAAGFNRVGRPIKGMELSLERRKQLAAEAEAVRGKLRASLAFVLFKTYGLDCQFNSASVLHLLDQQPNAEVENALLTLGKMRSLNSVTVGRALGQLRGVEVEPGVKMQWRPYKANRYFASFTKESEG